MEPPDHLCQPPKLGKERPADIGVWILTVIRPICSISVNLDYESVPPMYLRQESNLLEYMFHRVKIIWKYWVCHP